jgi:hypothetical protein
VRKVVDKYGSLNYIITHALHPVALYPKDKIMTTYNVYLRGIYAYQVTSIERDALIAQMTDITPAGVQTGYAWRDAEGDDWAFAEADPMPSERDRELERLRHSASNPHITDVWHNYFGGPTIAEQSEIDKATLQALFAAA